MRRVFALCFFMLGLAIPPAANAQAYPNRVIKIVVPAGPGGSGDIGGRLFASQLEKRVGRTVIVENRVGANGTIGVKYVVSAPADGYTLCWVSGTSTHPMLVKNNSVDALSELAPISMVIQTFFVVLTSKNLPLTSVAEIVAYAKTNPGKLNYASVNNAPIDLYMATLAEKVGKVMYTAIPYKGGPEQQAAISKGEANITFASVLSAVPLLKAGKVNAIMVTSKQRSPLLPDVPTSDEAGVNSFEAVAYSGLWAQLATPQAIIQRLSEESVALAKDRDFAQKVIDTFGAPPVGTTPTEARRLVEQELQILSNAVRMVGFEAK